MVSDLDNHRPEQPSPLELAASVGKYSRVNLQGNFQPFRERFSMDVTGNIEALDLPPISPYIVKSLGYNFVNGQMDMDVNLKIVLGKLQGESNFRLNNLKVKAAEKKTEAGQDTGLKMPLESTLKLLRDKKNNIQLKVPISGDITDPQFSFRDAINQAVVRALTMASFSYLKYMLGPYGLGINVAELAIKAIPGIRLQPVVFKPGSSDLNQDAVAYLKKIATILRDRTDLQVSVCGLATETDRSFLSKQSLKQGTASSSIDNQLLELAQKRAESIKDHLIGLYEIENKRIFICKPELDKNSEAPPRAELLV
jgi:outer membrane protein OmpA-like peptidoglycan-associated protein